MTVSRTVITKRMAQKIDRGSHQVVGKPPKVTVVDFTGKKPKETTFKKIVEKATQADLKKVSKKDSKKKK